MSEAETVKKDSDMLTFTLFSDLHYKEGMYIACVSDMESILKRAAESGSDFIIHGGDFCNDYVGSPEITNVYLKNKYNIPAYGIYGNHELETNGNTMSVVTPLLTNRPDSVVWGTASGKIEDGTVGYYYFDIKGFRIVCTDTNYSVNPKTKKYEHNAPASFGPPDGNFPYNCLGNKQLRWLENVLTDAAHKHINCIIMSHDSYSGVWDSSPDCEKVRKIFKKVNGISDKTVIAAINGHYHRNCSAVKDNIYYLNINSVFNGVWRVADGQHYVDGQVFDFTKYNAVGDPIETYRRNIFELWQAKNTYFYEEPLSAIVKITRNGLIEIDGSETTWRYNVVPELSIQDMRRNPQITSEVVTLK